MCMGVCECECVSSILMLLSGGCTVLSFANQKEKENYEVDINNLVRR